MPLGIKRDEDDNDKYEAVVVVTGGVKSGVGVFVVVVADGANICVGDVVSCSGYWCL